MPHIFFNLQQDLQARDSSIPRKLMMQNVLKLSKGIWITVKRTLKQLYRLLLLIQKQWTSTGIFEKFKPLKAPRFNVKFFKVYYFIHLGYSSEK